MIQNFIKIALRSLMKNKVYSFINILGLSVGLACFILIGMYVMAESGYDRFHPDYERTYRVALNRIYPDHVNHYAIIPNSIRDGLVSDIPEVESGLNVFKVQNEAIITYEDRSFEEGRVLFVDSTFFDFFGFKLAQGDPNTALTKQGSLVLSAKTAKKYFGETDAMGKILTTDFGPFTVTGVLDDQQYATHLEFDILGSIVSVPFALQENWTGFIVYSYIKLQPHTSPEQVEAKIPDVVSQYAGPAIQRNLGVSYNEYVAAGNGYDYFLQAVDDIHLGSNLEFEMAPNGSRTYISIFTIVALFILVIACINFMNLSTARSTERAREVGVRKVMGSDRQALIYQFLTESVLISIISLLVALVFLQLFMPSFNQLSGKGLEIGMLMNLKSIGFLVLLVIIVGLLAGSYPAFVLSGFSPVVVMKGKFKNSSSGTLLRNGLVVFQFFISIVLLAATLVVIRQMDYMRNKELGFHKDSVLVLEGVFAFNEQYDAFKKEIQQMRGVINAGASNTIMGEKASYFGIQFQPEGQQEILTTRGIVVDDYFLETMGIKTVLGRPFSEQFNDSATILLNESAVRELRISDPIGFKMTSPGFGPDGANITFTVVGVVEDFHFQSLHEQVIPLIILNNNQPLNFLTVRLESDQVAPIIAQIERMWKDRLPQRPISYFTLNESLNKLYQKEDLSANIFTVFSSLAILIACVGLFGLAAYTTAQRTKEIGIRKVLGATVPTIMVLISKDFFKLILIAFLIAVPIIYWLMNQWLSDFAFRIHITWSVYAYAGLAAAFIALITISYLTMKAAMANPVNSIKSE